MKLIGQGAEAKVYRKQNLVLKERVKKGYRLTEIDSKLRKLRTRGEAKLISLASRLGIPVPSILDIDEKKMLLTMDFIEGVKVRDWVDSKKSSDEIKKVMKQIGQLTRKLHEGSVTHGDLTTSNLLLQDGKINFIDFGLGQFTDKIEDKAVDIHVLKECLKSKHHEHWVSYWGAFKQGYKDKKVLHQLELVEARARYKRIS